MATAYELEKRWREAAKQKREAAEKEMAFAPLLREQLLSEAAIYEACANEISAMTY